MTSQRKLKKRAGARGMSAAELQLLELVQEILDDVRWMQILAYSNQYLLNQKLEVTQEERDRILEAATRAVDKDSKLHEWNARLGRVKEEIANIQRRVGAALEAASGSGPEAAGEAPPATGPGSQPADRAAPVDPDPAAADPPAGTPAPGDGPPDTLDEPPAEAGAAW